MLEQAKILTSRKAYEFRQDDLRLSSICLQPIQSRIQQLFNFQSSTIGAPLASFGEVIATYPPGAVFDLGAWVHEERHIVPIRFLHFEPNRIVIDVAGPTEAIDDIAAHLFNFLSELKAADESPVVGKPLKVLVYSEITAKFPDSLENLIPRPLRKVLSKTIPTETVGKPMRMIPSLSVQLFPANEVLSATPSISDPHTFSLTLRSGTRPDERICFSSAPLSSEEHMLYLDEMLAFLSKKS